MKMLLLLAVILPIALYCHGQEYNQKEDPTYIYGQLTGPDITTGVLLNRAVVLASPAYFNGTADSLSEYYSWQQLYTQFYHGSLSKTGLVRPDTLHNLLRNYLYHEVPLLITHYRYNELLPTADSLGLITFDNNVGRYQDVPNRLLSPYTEGQVFSVAVPTRKWNNNGVTYRISSNYWFGNEPAPSSLDIDFSDGLGYRTVAMNSTLTINYATTGTHIIKVRHTGSAGLVKARTELRQTDPTPPDLSYAVQASRDWPGQLRKGRAVAHIQFGEGNLADINNIQFRKPLIFVEGIEYDYFSMLENHTFAEVIGWTYDRDGQVVPVLNPFHGNYIAPAPNTVIDWNNSNFNLYAKNKGYVNGENGWDDMVVMNEDFPPIEKLPKLRQQLVQDGYDIIYFDYSEGADLIQQNAMALVELIEWVNAHRDKSAITEEIAIIGASMGGQVSRFALAWMEEQNLCHNTKLWVSFDSPNRGAYAPLGLQHLIADIAAGHPGDNGAGAREGRAKLLKPASKQMLNYHYHDEATPLRNAWQGWQNQSKSYPSQLRKVAVSNGSRLAQDQGFGGGALLLRTTTQGSVVFNARRVFALPGADHNNNPNTIYYDRNGLFSSAQVVQVPANTPHYDRAPGGKFGSMEIFERAAPGTFAFGPHGHGNHCFIPIISALGVTESQTGPIASANLFYNIASIQDNTPNSAKYAFDAYFAPDGNEPHIQITDGTPATLHDKNDNVYPTYGTLLHNNATWILNELLYSIQSLPSVLSPTTITNGEYNFGSPYRTRLRAIRVENGGKLYINRTGIVSGGNGQELAQAGNFQMTTACGAYVLINQGGLLELGTVGATQSTGYRAEVHFKAGSTLHIFKGTTVLNNSSKIIMEAGSTLVLHGTLQVENNALVEIHNGATLLWEPDGFLKLNGDNAVLDIQGKLRLANTATFTFTGAPTTGFIRFNTSTPFDVGTGARFVLQGNGANDKIAEVTQDHILQPTVWSGFDFFLENGSVDMKQNASIQFGNANVRINNMYFLGDVSNPYNAIFVNGCGREFIRFSRFSGGKIGLSADLRICNGSPIYLESVNFDNCITGLRTNGKGAKLVNCNFTGITLPSTNTVPPQTQKVGEGWLMIGAEFPDSRTTNCIFTNYKNGIKFSSSTGSELFYESSQATQNDTGVEFDGPGTLIARCGGIFYNTLGMQISNDAVLNLYGSKLSLVNNGYYPVNINHGGGTPTISSVATSQTINFTFASVPSFYKGYNNFTGLNHLYSGITGIIKFPDSETSNALNANYNKWHTQLPGNPSNGGSSNLPPDANLHKQDFLTRVLIEDGFPLASPPSCNVSPCVIPFNNVANLPCEVEIIVNNCPSCEVISNAYFSNEKLNSAVLIALSNSTRYNPNGDDELALNMFREILTTPLIDTTQEELNILLRAYEYMKAAYAWSLKTNQTNASVSLSLMNTVSQQIAFSSTNHALSDPVFFAYMDQALAAYSAGNLSLSRTKLNSALPLSRPHTAQYAQYWDCLITANEQLRDSVIDIYTFYDMISNCSNNQPQLRTAQDNNTELPQPAKIEKQAGLILELIPNPASETVIAQIKGASQGEVILQISDSKGHIVRTQRAEITNEISESIVVPLYGFTDGLYIVKIVTNKGVTVRKLIVNH